MSSLAQKLLLTAAIAATGMALAQEPATDSAEAPVEEASSAMAGGSNFYKTKAEGWFWYKDPPKEVKKKPEKKLPPPPPPPPSTEKPAEVKSEPVKPAGPPVGSVAWIKVNLPLYRDRAIDSPTNQNIQAYYYLQRLMMDKANVFAERSTSVIMRDPFLDEDSRRPVATYAANTMNREASKRKDTVLKDLSNKVGLFYFFKSDCELCVEQAGVLQGLSFKTGIPILPISLDGKPLDQNIYSEYRIDDGQAKKLNIFNAPALALAIPPNKTEIVGYGAITQDVLENRILMVARDNQIISHQVFASTQPLTDTGLLTMEDTKGLSEEDLKDPAVLVEHLRNQLAQKTALEGK